VNRLRDEHGFASVMELALTVTMWLFPIAILVVSLPTWVERQSLARLASSEAAREVVLAGSWDAGAGDAEAMVAQLARNHDVPPEDLDLDLGGSLERGQAVTATVTVTVPALVLPLITSVPEFTLTSVSTEAVDQYRSFP
jgi:hypothetical protein